MNLKQLRLNEKKSQSELCSALDIPLRSYQEYESGRSQMRYSTLIKIADYFGCSVDYLLGHETKQLMHIDSLTENQQKALSIIKELDDDAILIAMGYLQRLHDETQPNKIKPGEKYGTN